MSFAQPAPDRRAIAQLLQKAAKLAEEGRLAQALTHYAAAHRLDPYDVRAATDFALARLQLGDLSADAWNLYDARFHLLKPEHQPFQLGLPLWDGRPMPGRLLIWQEQGLGDQIVSLSFLHGIAQRQPDLVVELPERLIPLARRSFPAIEFVPVATAEIARGCAAMATMASLPRYFVSAIRDIRVDRAFLGADPALREGFRAEFEAAAAGRLIVGLSWDTHGERRPGGKSPLLESWAPLLDRSDVHFINLESTSGAGDLDKRLPGRVTTPDFDRKNDLDRLAAAIAACDAVASIPNLVGHLSGALGISTRIMMREGFQHTWYWFEALDRQPFYPDCKVFRGPASVPFRQICTRLAADVGGQAQAQRRGA